MCCNRCACGGSLSTDSFNPLNAELNPICHLLALLGAHLILHVSRIRVNSVKRAVPGNKLLDLPSYDSPHIGSWAETGVWLSRWIS